MQELKKHIDGEWWTSEHIYEGHKLLIKMRESKGSKIHIFAKESNKVVKTFRFNFSSEAQLLKKAKKWINNLKI